MSPDTFLHNLNLHNGDDMDALLEFADLLRQSAAKADYPQITHLINHTIINNYSEAFSWAMAILQEELLKKDSILKDFHCDIGGCIANYDEFINSLQVDFNSLKNHIEKVYDKNGEVEAFFNVMVYKTIYDNIFLISSENFDTRDNDYINYKLSFVKDTDVYNS